MTSSQLVQHPSAPNNSSLYTKKTKTLLQKLILLKYYAHIVLCCFLLLFALLYTMQSFAFADVRTTPLFPFALCGIILLIPFYIPLVVLPQQQHDGGEDASQTPLKDSPLFTIMRTYSTLLTPVELILIPSIVLFCLVMLICVLDDSIQTQKEFWIFHSIVFFFMSIPWTASALSGALFYFCDRMMSALEHRPANEAYVVLIEALLSFFMNLSSALRLIGGLVLFATNMVYAGDLSMYTGFVVLLVLGLFTLSLGYLYQAESRKLNPSTRHIVLYHILFVLMECVCTLILTILIVYSFSSSALLSTVFGDVISLFMMTFYLVSLGLLMLISAVSMFNAILIMFGNFGTLTGAEALSGGNRKSDYEGISEGTTDDFEESEQQV